MHFELSPHSDTPSELDVFDVRSFLLRKLPAELGDDIIDKAEYWPSISANCSAYIRVPSWVGGERRTSFCYAITPPIPTISRLVKTRGTTRDEVEFDEVEAKVRRRVKKVIFRVTSHDQGWGGDTGLKLPYAGSWTWFDAEIWRPNTVNGTSNFPTKTSTQPSSFDITSDLPISSPTDETLEAAGYHRIMPPSAAGHFSSSKAWLLQRNMRASSQLRDHTVIWSDGSGDDGPGVVYHSSNTPTSTALGRSIVADETTSPSWSWVLGNSSSDLGLDSEDLDSNLDAVESDWGALESLQRIDTKEVATYCDEYGFGNGAEFVRAIQPGDRVVIVARALLPGWSNCVKRMSVDIRYTVV
ncbi:hypothetical protein P691DRAFT_737591 [Macrolepiota fuliginosa MF-IS2]|uniref:Uncharacterized protein n=1 Tax=Macrolepiota fuliginosa MF-IS2 TaxID=1400762 RepID=A0A9P5X5A9_9AGAR|nr:hypothetical protein P691DRAFT_737591 [Macrolepiota fuliginosa MF-IS2]